MAKKVLKCETCQYYKDGNCIHESNISIRIRYRKEEKVFDKEAKELEKNCKNYKENGV